jgi:predicted transcriptional regulator
MITPAHALISLEERFAEGILNGTKLVELRRRPMRLSVGTTIWMYVKVPIGKVTGSAVVGSMHSLAPTTLWRRYGDVSGLRKSEFLQYFEGNKQGFVLVLEKPKRLSCPVTLVQLRQLNGAFQPPQFFQHLDGQGPLVSAFTGKSASMARRRALLPTMLHPASDFT